jgi:hypothetical protein
MLEASMVSDTNNGKTAQPQGLVFSLCAARVQRVCSATASITDIQLANPPYGPLYGTLYGTEAEQHQRPPDEFLEKPNSGLIT